MADDKGSAPYKAHDRRPGKAGGKRKTRRKRGAAKLRTRASLRAAEARAALRSETRAAGDSRAAAVIEAQAFAAEPVVEAAVQEPSPASCAPRRTVRRGRPGSRRKPRPIIAGAAVCPRGVSMRVRVKGGLPVVLRSMGRRGRKAGCEVRIARLDGLPVIPPTAGADRRLRLAQPEQSQQAARPGSPGGAASVSGGGLAGLPPYGQGQGSSWALPLPRREEPLVEASAAPEPAARPVPHLAPLARNRAPVLWRDGFVAHVEAWVRGTAERLGRLMSAGGRPAKPAPARSRQPVPAIARANREISALREENEKLRLQIEALERLRKAARAEAPANAPGFAKA